MLGGSGLWAVVAQTLGYEPQASKGRGLDSFFFLFLTTVVFEMTRSIFKTRCSNLSIDNFCVRACFNWHCFFAELITGLLEQFGIMSGWSLSRAVDIVVHLLP